jgi:cation:H+ antiporter
MHDFLLLLVSMALLLGAARIFVEGISGLAASLGVPQLVIGMTVVAFGTSTPELVVNSISAMRGSSGLAFGNIVGSCIVNVGVVLAVTALLRPLKVEPSLITREIPMLIVAVAALLVLSHDRALNGAAADQWVRGDGLVLLLLFGIFLYYTARQAIAVVRSDAFIAEVREGPVGALRLPAWRQAVWTIAGFAGVSLGAQWTVERSVALARGFGVSETVIGLTILSIGTTLPELATCVLAARQGNPDIALGNVVGSNLFNVLCIGGLVSAIHPVPIPAGGHTDLGVMALMTMVLMPIAVRSQRTITRGEGALLLAIFLGYLAWRLSEAA